MSNRDDLNASPLCGKCKGVAHLKRLHIKTKWYDVMSTTTDGNRVVRARRILLIHWGPEDFVARVIMFLFGGRSQVEFDMDINLPDGIKSQAKDRRRFHLNLLTVAPSQKKGRFLICCRLKDIIFTPGNPSGEVINFFYVGYFDTEARTGRLSEYTNQDFVADPIVLSLFRPEEAELFKTF